MSSASRELVKQYIKCFDKYFGAINSDRFVAKYDYESSFLHDGICTAEMPCPDAFSELHGQA